MNPFSGSRSCGAGKWIAGGVAAAAVLYLYRSATSRPRDDGPSDPSKSNPSDSSAAAAKPANAEPINEAQQSASSNKQAYTAPGRSQTIPAANPEDAVDHEEEEAEDPFLTRALAGSARGCGEWLEEHAELVREMDFEWLNGESLAELVEQHVLSPVELSRLAYFLSAFAASGQLVLSQEPGSIDQRWFAECERWWMQSLQLLGLVLGREEAREAAHPLSASSSWVDTGAPKATGSASATSASALDASWADLSHPPIALCLYSKGRKMTPSQISAACRDCEQVLSVPGAFDYEWVISSIFKGCALLFRPSLSADHFESFINVQARSVEPSDIKVGHRVGLHSNTDRETLTITDPYNLSEDQLAYLRTRYPPSASGFYGQFLRDCLLASCRESVLYAEKLTRSAASTNPSLSAFDSAVLTCRMLEELHTRAQQSAGDQEDLDDIKTEDDEEEKEDADRKVWRELKAILPRGLVLEALREARAEAELIFSKWDQTARCAYVQWRDSAGATSAVPASSDPSAWEPFERVLTAENLLDPSVFADQLRLVAAGAGAEERAQLATRLHRSGLFKASDQQ